MAAANAALPPIDARAFKIANVGPDNESVIMMAPTGKAAQAIQKLSEQLKVSKAAKATVDWKESVFPLDMKILEATSSLPSIEERLKEMQRKIDDALLGPFKVHVGIDPASKTGGTVHSVLQGRHFDTLILDDLMPAADAPWPSAPFIMDESTILYGAARGRGKSRMKGIWDDLRDRALKPDFGYPITAHKAQGKSYADTFDLMHLKPYQRDMARWLTSSPFKLRDTKMTSMHRAIYGRDRTADQYQGHVREFILRQAHNFAPWLPDKPPVARELGPMANLFLWGPDGEWTGIWAMPETVLEKAKNYDGYYDMGSVFEVYADIPIMKVGGGTHRRYRDHQGGYAGMDRYAQAYEELRYDLDREPLHQRFCSLEAWTAFQGTVIREDRTDVVAEVRNIQRLLQQMGADPAILAEWSALMGRTKFGFGVLRDGKDRYDPFGVLALMNNAAWKWDEAERGWALDGSCYDIQTGQLLCWLGGTPRATAAAQAFVDAVTDFSDRQKSFKPLIKLLADASVYNAALNEQYSKFREGLIAQAEVSGREFARRSDPMNPRYMGVRGGKLDYYDAPETLMARAVAHYHDKHRSMRDEYQRHRMELDLMNPWVRNEDLPGARRDGKLDGVFTDMEPEILNPEIFGDEA